MQLNYSLVVNGPVYGCQSARHAYAFALALLKKGHCLSSIFFYQDGVSNASTLVIPANDEFDLTQAWQQIAKQHNVALNICVAAALRRGIVDQHEAALHQRDSYNLADGFNLAGLGELAHALLTQDRIIQF